MIAAGIIYTLLWILWYMLTQSTLSDELDFPSADRAKDNFYLSFCQDEPAAEQAACRAQKAFNRYKT